MPHGSLALSRRASAGMHVPAHPISWSKPRIATITTWETHKRHEHTKHAHASIMRRRPLSARTEVAINLLHCRICNSRTAIATSAGRNAQKRHTKLITGATRDHRTAQDVRLTGCIHLTYRFSSILLRWYVDEPVAARPPDCKGCDSPVRCMTHRSLAFPDHSRNVSEKLHGLCSACNLALWPRSSAPAVPAIISMPHRTLPSSTLELTSITPQSSDHSGE